MDLVLPLISRIGLEVFGTQPARPEEVKKAQETLAAAPTGSPLQVARYFEALTEVNADSESYNSEWKIRSNPVVGAFFAQATDYSPPFTDQTKWCAAFMNWCLMRAGRPHTRSASSGSFRCFSQDAVPAQPGDVAVFKNRGQDKPCSGSGHVGFWLGETGGRVQVLGGNQGNAIKVSAYPATEASAGSSPWLLTVRRIGESKRQI